ncbi:hypothetical protein VTJ49DRAFT_2349 [Mycothermus thermophilus]|uniref:Telomerase reverse transcriptase n=1 Tax=Humicola insolens TaxID=85995 RepID=A0ABR3VRC4_HUMIN
MGNPGKRKRAQSGSHRDHTHGAGHDAAAHHPPSKRLKSQVSPVSIKHVLLDRYYSETQTLRQYALAQLPASSRLRRRKIASVGQVRSGSVVTEDEQKLADLLDNTFVSRRLPRERGHGDQDTQDGPSHRWEQWLNFSQKGDESHVTLSDGLKGCIFSQSEIVDFVIWLLFQRETAGSWPRHLLCDGFRRQAGPDTRPHPAAAADVVIPGLCAVFPNPHVRTLKASPWPQLLLLLGKEGERIMIDLLVDCAIFRPVKAGRGNLYQLCGIPITELEPLPEVAAKGEPTPTATKTAELRPSDISFVRSRMFYARAALNARGLVHFGLRHIHVLNRFPRKSVSDGEHDRSTVHIMMYMFPRQFGLHNVFTSSVDRQKTAQKFQDYTLREEEIAAKFPAPKAGDKSAIRIPKRLRGKTMQLIQKLQVLHSRCSYAEMLHHYCPPGVDDTRVIPASSRPLTQPPKRKRKSRPTAPPSFNLQYSSLTDLATPASSVSAFCQAVVSKVIPDEFWGKGEIRDHNKACFLKKVHHFIHLRRFESLCLHEVMQGMKTTDLEWLTPPALSGHKCSQSDTRKRTEIFYEFLYYLFDSFLIPLIRSNFYVTESSVNRYRIFFFRHDVWRYVAEPAMALLKTNMFEEVKTEDALRILQSRRLGCSQVRLLPKQDKMRPIMNLRRRTLLHGNKKVLGPSINSVLGPVNSMFRLEKVRDPSRLGSSLFSVGDIYQRIKDFKNVVGEGRPFYFVKVDVQAAFDTIPQDAMIALLRQIPQQSHYRLFKHVEIALLEAASAVKPTKRWHTLARADGDGRTFAEYLEDSLAKRKKNTVFVPSAVQRSPAAWDLLALTESHITQNLVRIGKKYYRQRAGIPQGSVLSSALCSYLYADLERARLSFLQDDNGDGHHSLLMRLIDDFVLITTDPARGRRFAEVMLSGVPEYGVAVAPAKSLANFPLVVGGLALPMPEDPHRFPYCGLWIDCKTLAITKQREALSNPGSVLGQGGIAASAVLNSLTVEYSRAPGWNFKRKVINAFKIQSHLLFYDTAHNPRRTVLANLFAAFTETAIKMWAYARCLRSAGGGGPDARVLIDTIETLVDVAYVLLTSRSRRERYPGKSHDEGGAIMTRKKVVRCIVTEFDLYFGSGTLEDWPRLCWDIGLEGDLSSNTKCRKALATVHINIWDLMDAVKQGVYPQRFSSARKLADYTMRTGRIYPKRKAKAMGPVAALLRMIYR